MGLDPARYAELFLTESREHMSAINHALLELERTGGGAAPVEALFRAVHTVKGMSATMGYTAVAEVSHETETLLDGVRSGDVPVSQGVMDVLFQAADALEASIEQAVTGKSDHATVSAVIARLREITGSSTAEHALPGETSPAATPSGRGTLVRVRLQEGTPLRGVRAFMVVKRAGDLGPVSGIEPPMEVLQKEGFERDFALRVQTEATHEEIEQHIRSAGYVDAVMVGDPAPSLRRSVAITTPIAAIDAIEPPRRASREMEQKLASAAARPAARHIRIDLRRLDNLMNLIGELVIARGRLSQIAGALQDPALEEAVGHTSRLVSELQDEIMTSRMVPVWQVFDRFPRLVRDAARMLDKQVEFVVEGKEIELDRSMLDEIGDPIVHLLRNAIDHGIEPPAARLAAGKPPEGQLRLSASRDRSSVLIRVSDDGKGIDREKVLARAKSLGIVDATRTELTDDEMIKVISRSGFSTADQVTDISGRGVGIDAVQARVRALGGSLDIKSTPGEGTTVTARLPVTLAIVRSLLARVQDETYALPMTHVNETVDLTPDRTRVVRGREVLVLRDEVLPLVHLRERIGLPRTPGLSQVVVVEMMDRRAGVVVDELTGQQEIVVKQFDAVRGAPAMFSGATILGDGAPALILDVGSLF